MQDRPDRRRGRHIQVAAQAEDRTPAVVGHDLVAKGWGSPVMLFPLESFAEQDRWEAFHHGDLIAKRSSEGKTPILRREVVLPVHHSAAQLARAALDDAIPPPALNGRSDDPRLAVSELVTNAVRHAGLDANSEMIHLRIEADDDHVHIEVEQPTSAGGVHRVERPGNDGPFGGFGLGLVEASADTWGFEPGPPGRVWFEFRV